MTTPTPEQPTVTTAAINDLFAAPDAALPPETDVAADAVQADDTDDTDVPAPASAAGAELTPVAAAPEIMPDQGPHPTIAKRVIFDGNSFDIPCSTPAEILHDNNALRRAYATAMARPELTQAQMDDGTTEIDDHVVPTLPLRVRPQVKGASPAGAPALAQLLQRVPVRSTDRGMLPLVQHFLRGGRLTCALAVHAKLAVSIGSAIAGHADPRTTKRYDRRGAAAQKRAVDLLNVPYVPRKPQE